MVDFKRRSTQSELMDQGGISFAEFHHCLKNLEVINTLTLAYRPTLKWMKGFITSDSLCIVDVGSGSGDMLRRIERLASRYHHSVSLTGVDLNHFSKKSALLSSPQTSINYETADIFSYESRDPVDVILCSQFTHHLNDDDLVHFLHWIDSHAGKGWFINDLHRHPIPYYFIKIATAMFSRNRLIRHDAALSVARSFTRREWQDLLAKAGITGAKISWFFPFRLCVSCLKQ
jgi:2-polyprenyl-3-methyl-5-hydroxy-6-metoxy-1,4-benzoquinol methylase